MTMESPTAVTATATIATTTLWTRTSPPRRTSDGGTFGVLPGEGARGHEGAQGPRPRVRARVREPPQGERLAQGRKVAIRVNFIVAKLPEWR
jgi:hypothetical protein